MDCKITEQLFSVINLLHEEQKKPKDYGVGKPLYNSEIRLLDAVHRHPKLKVSDLSQILSITKSAVTQLADRLIERGLIETYQIEGNKKEKYYKLTSLGETAIEGHARIYSQKNAEICAYYCTLSEKEKTIISDFLEHLEKNVPFCEFSCSGKECYGEEF